MSDIKEPQDAIVEAGAASASHKDANRAAMQYVKRVVEEQYGDVEVTVRQGRKPDSMRIEIKAK